MYYVAGFVSIVNIMRLILSVVLILVKLFNIHYTVGFVSGVSTRSVPWIDLTLVK